MCSAGIFSWREIYVFSVLLAWALGGPPHVLDDSFKYITRPDIEAPRWNVTVFDRQLVTPGYWFVDSYDYLDQSRDNGGKWTAPYIFDQHGELVWSGSYLSQQYDTFDFRLSNVLGRDMMTFLYPRNRSAVILDEKLDIYKSFTTSTKDIEMHNMHDLIFVDNGTRVLFFYDEEKNVSAAQSEAIGLTHQRCKVRENSFHEIDLTKDSEVVFSWSSSDHVDLRESTFTAGDYSVEDRCLRTETGWDFIHANSIDKFPDDGSYLMSGRYTDTIYKIHPNGPITWRLGGDRSDFDSDFKFARQHHARILEHNATHTTLSFFDNAKAEDAEESATDYSRSVIATLRTDTAPMTATLNGDYRHPDGHGGFTLGRGSTQVLPNGNVFTCWVDGLLHSEHSPTGHLIMEARVKQKWLKSYRSYKFPFVGRPSRPPDVYSATMGAAGGNSTTTSIHVSWNGATEVASWKLYKSDSSGSKSATKHVATMPRTGFETVLTLSGYAVYVVVEGLDRQGNSLGRSNVAKTIVSSPLDEEVIAQESAWLQSLEDGNAGSRSHPGSMKLGKTSTAAKFSAAFALGLSCGISIAAGWRFCLRKRWRGCVEWWPQLSASRTIMPSAGEEAVGLTQDYEDSTESAIKEV